MASTGLTKAQIVLAAQQNVSRGSELDAICDRILNTLLNLLYENYSWRFLESLATITLTAGSQTFTLPADYLRVKTFTIVRSDLNATNPPNTPIAWMEMEDYQNLQSPLTTGIPQVFTSLRRFTNFGNPGVTGYLYPVPNITYSARMFYLYKPAFDIGDSTVLEFSDQYTLIDLLTNELLGLGYNNNVQTKNYDPKLLEKTIARYRMMEVDSGIYAKRAILDRRFFRPGSNGVRGGSWLNVNR
jgi:hypothetical protein